MMTDEFGGIVVGTEPGFEDDDDDETLKLLAMLEKVETQQDLADSLMAISKHYRNRPDEWEVHNIGDFLESIAVLVEMRVNPQKFQRARLAKMTQWQMMGDFIFSGRTSR